MTREIKFRAWDKKDKKMVFPLGFNQFDDGIRPTFYIDGKNGQTLLNYKDCEIMQFTGLKDKNGKDIFEGDILKHNSGYPGKGWVEWMGYNSTNTWIGKYIIWDSIVKDECQYMPAYNIEVIGNIYENKDLLKQHDPKQ